MRNIWYFCNSSSVFPENQPQICTYAIWGNWKKKNWNMCKVHSTTNNKYICWSLTLCKFQWRYWSLTINRRGHSWVGGGQTQDWWNPLPNYLYHRNLQDLEDLPCLRMRLRYVGLNFQDERILSYWKFCSYNFKIYVYVFLNIFSP